MRRRPVWYWAELREEHRHRVAHFVAGAVAGAVLCYWIFSYLGAPHGCAPVQ